MKWINHTLIAAAPCALVAPLAMPAAVCGATAPDWIEWVARALGHPLKHRGPTHWVAGWLAACLFALMLPGAVGVLALAFALGGLSHVLADALTVSGVPFSPASDRRFHLAGGRLRTGGAGEYAAAWGVVLICAALHGAIGHKYGEFVPFFPDWSGRYERGEVTAKEWKDNRFKFF
jgi:inner membrane protein